MMTSKKPTTTTTTTTTTMLRAALTIALALCLAADARRLGGLGISHSAQGLRARLHAGGITFHPARHRAPELQQQACASWTLTLSLQPPAFLNATTGPLGGWNATAWDDAGLAEAAARPGCGGELEERVDRRADGIEHSVLLRSGPERGLELALAVTATGPDTLLKLAEPGQDGLRGMQLVCLADGRQLFNYRHLVVFDATGRRIDADMSANGDAGAARELTLTLRVLNTEPLVYPVLVDPLGSRLAVDVMNSSHVFFQVAGNASTFADKFAQTPSTTDSLQCAFPFTFDSKSYDRCIYGSNRRGMWCTSTSGKYTMCADMMFGSSVGLGNLYSTNTGRLDLVVGAPRYTTTSTQWRVGRVYLFQNYGNGAFSEPRALAQHSSFNQHGTHFGTSIGIGKLTSTSTYSTAFSGSPVVAGSMIYTGAASGPTSAQQSYKCRSYTVGTKLVCGHVGIGSNSGGFRFDHTAKAFAATTVGMSGYAPYRPGSFAYGDGSRTSVFAVSDTLARGSSANQVLVGLVAVFNTCGTTCNAIWKRYGDQTDAQFGGAITMIDANNDGRLDLVIASPFYSGARFNGGRIQLFLGRASAGSALFESQPSWEAYGEGDSDLFGTALSRLGDLDGDGTDDLAVGAPGANQETGRIYVYLGSAQPNAIETSGMRLHQVLNGADSGGRFGEALSAGGDVNGDGYPDLAIGIPGYAAPMGAGFMQNVGKAVVLQSIPFTEVAVSITSDIVGDYADASQGGFTLSVVVENTGHIASESLTLVIVLPDTSRFGTPTGCSSVDGSTCTVQLASINSGSSATAELDYVLSGSVSYPTTATFTASVGVTNRILRSVSATRTIRVESPISVSMQSPVAFEVNDLDYEATPGCTATNDCIVVKGKKVALRNLGFVNNGPSTAFGTALRIAYPDGVVFFRAQHISDQSLYDTLSCSGTTGDTLCLFSSLQPTESLSMLFDDLELVFRTPNLLQGGYWSFTATFESNNLITNPGQTTASSNLMYAPETSANLAVMMSSVSAVDVTQPACCAEGGSSGVACAGNTLELSIPVSNQGPFSASLVIANVSFTLPAGATIPLPPRIVKMSTVTTCSALPTPGSYTCSVPGNVLGPGQIFAVRPRIRLASSVADGASIAYDISVAAVTVDENMSNNQGSGSHDICRRNKFSVVLSGEPALLSPHQNVTVTATVVNTGPSDFAGLATLNFTLPDDVALHTPPALLAAPNTACAPADSSSLYVCAIPVLTANSPSNPATARWRTSFGLPSAAIPGGNATMGLSVGAVVLGGASASYFATVENKVDLRLLATTDRASAAIDQTHRLTLSVQNLDLFDTAHNVTVTVALPVALNTSLEAVDITSGWSDTSAGDICTLTVVEDPEDADAGSILVCTFPYLSAYNPPCDGSGRRCLVVFSVTSVAQQPQAPYEFSTDFFIRSEVVGNELDTNFGKLSVLPFVLNLFANLATSLVAPPTLIPIDESVTYTITVNNIGVVDAENVTLSISLRGVEDEDPIELEHVAVVNPDDLDVIVANASLATCVLPSLPPGGSVTFGTTLRVLGPAGAIVVVAASARTDSTELDFANNGDTSASQIVQEQVDLALATSALPASAAISGENITYSFAIRNFGMSTSRNTMLTTNRWPIEEIPVNRITNIPSWCVFNESSLSCNVSKAAILPAAARLSNGAVQPSFYSFEISGTIVPNVSLSEPVRNALFRVEDAVITEDADPSNNVANITITFYAKAQGGDDGDSGFSELYAILIAVGCGLFVVLVLGYVLYRKGFFKRKALPPSLDDEDADADTPDGDDAVQAENVPASDE